MKARYPFVALECISFPGIISLFYYLSLCYIVTLLRAKPMFYLYLCPPGLAQGAWHMADTLRDKMESTELANMRSNSFELVTKSVTFQRQAWWQDSAVITAWHFY